MRPSHITLAADHCPHAVTLSEQGTPRDESVFAVGIAAHAFLEHWAVREDWPAIAARLATQGTPDAADPHPPLPLEAVQEGMTLAGRWLDTHGNPPRAAIIEQSYSDGVVGTRVDVAWYTTPTSLLIRDYKSSWAADASTVLRVQAQVQVVAALAEDPELHEVRVEVANLRTRQLHGETIQRDDPRVAMWRATLHAAADALNGSRAASPGARCLGCPYVLACEPAAALRDTGDVVERWAIAAAEAKALEPLARAATEQAPAAGVGWYATEQRELREDAPQAIAAALDGRPLAEVLGAARLGVTALEALGKVLYPARTDAKARAAWVAELVQSAPVRRWGRLPEKKNVEG
jgi:hypothetical protein